MSKKTRRRFDAQLKAREALRDEATVAELAANISFPPTKLMHGKSSCSKGQLANLGVELGDLRLAARLLAAAAERVAMVVCSQTDLSVQRQCRLLGLARPGVYRQRAAPDPEELALMRWLDEQCLATPFYVSQRMTAELDKASRRVSRKRVQRLMRLMGPPPKISPSAQYRVYPYLLRGLTIDRTPSKTCCAKGARDLQHRPRCAIHQRGLYRQVRSRRGADQHGRPRALIGQRLRRAAVAQL
jgi:hypothetical protein